jgi:hypothetical protein
MDPQQVLEGHRRMTKLRLAICGPGRCGKDSASNWLRANTTLEYYQSTSEAAADVVYGALKDKHGYSNKQECWDDRLNHRVEWADTIWAYNQPDGLRLYRDMLDRNDILNGIRRTRELKACINAGLVTLTIWINRPNTTESVSNEITPEDCDMVLQNHEPQHTFPTEYHDKLRRLAESWGVYRG